MDYHPKKVPCQIYNVDTGIYVTTQPNPHTVIFSQIKKNIRQFFFVLTYMLLHIKQIVDEQQKRYLAKFIKLLLEFMSLPPTPNPYCNILTDKKKNRSKFIFCSYVYVTIYQKNGLI